MSDEGFAAMHAREPNRENPFASSEVERAAANDAPLRYRDKRPGTMLFLGAIVGAVIGCFAGAMISGTLGFIMASTNGVRSGVISSFDVAAVGAIFGGLVGACTGCIVGTVVGVVSGIEQYESRTSLRTSSLASAVAAAIFGGLAVMFLRERALVAGFGLGLLDIRIAACALAAGAAGFSVGLLLANTLRNAARRIRVVVPAGLTLEC